MPYLIVFLHHEPNGVEPGDLGHEVYLKLVEELSSVVPSGVVSLVKQNGLAGKIQSSGGNFHGFEKSTEIGHGFGVYKNCDKKGAYIVQSMG